MEDKQRHRLQAVLSDLKKEARASGLGTVGKWKTVWKVLLALHTKIKWLESGVKKAPKDFYMPLSNTVISTEV